MDNSLQGINMELDHLANYVIQFTAILQWFFIWSNPIDLFGKCRKVSDAGADVSAHPNVESRK